MERRLHQRFGVSSIDGYTKLRIKGLYDVRFIDFSERGFAFSSASSFAIGEHIELQLRPSDRKPVTLSAMVCNRRRESFNGNRYGVYFDGLSAQSEDHGLYLQAIKIPVDKLKLAEGQD